MVNKPDIRFAAIAAYSALAIGFVIVIPKPAHAQSAANESGYLTWPGKEQSVAPPSPAEAFRPRLANSAPLAPMANATTAPREASPVSDHAAQTSGPRLYSLHRDYGLEPAVLPDRPAG